MNLLWLCIGASLLCMVSSQVLAVEEGSCPDLIPGDNLNEKALTNVTTCWNITYQGLNRTEKVSLVIHTENLSADDKVTINANGSKPLTISGNQGNVVVLLSPVEGNITLTAGQTRIGVGKFGITATVDCVVQTSDNFPIPAAGVFRHPLYLWTNNKTSPPPCKWILVEDESKKYLTTVSFDLNLGTETLKVYNETQGEISQYDGNSTTGKAEDVIYPGMITIELSNHDVSGKSSMMAVYTRNEVPVACGGDITLSSAQGKTQLKPLIQGSQITCKWVVKSDPNTTILLQLDSSVTKLDNGADWSIRNGPSEYSQLLDHLDAISTPDHLKNFVVTAGNKAWVEFTSPIGVKSNAGFTLTQQGAGGFISGDQDLDIKGDGVFIVTVTDTNVPLLTLDNVSKLTASAQITVYAGHSNIPQNKLTTFSANFSSPKPLVFAPGNKMLIIASGFTSADSAKGAIKAVTPDCFKRSGQNSDVYSLTVASNSTYSYCAWSIQPNLDPKTDLIAVTLHDIKLGAKTTVNLENEKSALLVNWTSNATNTGTYYAPAGTTGLTLLVTPGNDANLDFSYDVIKACGGEIKSNQLVQSPLYPNQFPLGATCTWTLTPPTPTNNFTWISFSRFQVKEHPVVLSYTENTTTTTVANFTSEDQLHDVVIGRPLTFSWSSNDSLIDFKNTDYGFSADVKMIYGGGLLTDKTATVQTPHYPGTCNQSATCLWVIHADEIPGNKSVNIIKVTVTPGQGGKAPTLDIHDGRNTSVEKIKSSTNEYVSSRNWVTIMYDFVHEKENGTSYQITYTIEECNELCGNGRCMMKEWKCNGKNDCRDNSDEVNCSTTTNTIPSGKMAAAVIFSMIAGAFLAIGALVAFRYFRKRQSNYTQFQNIDT